MRFNFEGYRELFPKKEHIVKTNQFEEKEEESMLNETKEESQKEEKEVVDDGHGTVGESDS